MRTVVLLSNEPIEKARRVFLDAHSLTSVQLAGYCWRSTGKSPPNTIRSKIMRSWGTPCRRRLLLIGDKVFDHEGRFAYSYDLAAEWKKATRLPFAFAVWVARKYRPRPHGGVAACADFRYRAHLRSNSRTWFRQQTVRCVCLPYAEYRLYFRQSEA